MSKLIEQMYEAMATGCGTYMEASRLSEILAHIERLEALCDLAYSDGAQAGFNLGVTEDNDGLARIIESRKDAVKALLAKGRKHSGGGTTEVTLEQ